MLDWSWVSRFLWPSHFSFYLSLFLCVSFSIVSWNEKLQHFIFWAGQRCIIELAARPVRCFPAICEVTQQMSEARERAGRPTGSAGLSSPATASFQRRVPGPLEPQLDKYFSSAAARYRLRGALQRSARVSFFHLRMRRIAFLLFSLIHSALLWADSHMTSEREPRCV